MKDARPLGEILAEYARASGLASRSKVANAASAWLGAAGETCARHSRVVDLQQGVLHVTVDSAACLHEMANFRKAEILASLKCNRGCDSIHDIRFRLGELESG
jgi:predicted nucleic acid-binding Zn ribbon protein